MKSQRTLQSLTALALVGGLSLTASAHGGTWLMIAAKHDGTLYCVNGGTTVATGVIGVSTRINVITDAGSAKTSKTYVNGSLKATLNGISTPIYHKYGTYRLNSGNGP